MNDPIPDDRRDAQGPVDLREPFHLDELSEAPRLRIRGWTFILFGLLILTALLAQQLRPAPTLQHIADQPPAVVAPTGDLAVAYQAARPASLRIEARCAAPAAPQTLGIGTGFFVDSEGTLLTAYHVVDDTGPALCTTEFFGVDPDGAEYPLSLVGFDAYFDLAVLRATTDGAVPFIPLARTQPNVGTGIVAIGNSRGDFLEARSGRITRLGVQAGRADFADGTIELTAALAPGDSGGPVLNARGEAVGVVSYISFSPNSLSADTYVPPFLRGLALPQEFASYAVPVSLSSDLVSSVLSGARRDVPATAVPPTKPVCAATASAPFSPMTAAGSVRWPRPTSSWPSTERPRRVSSNCSRWCAARRSASRSC
jgi:S1-C subfamily serine protease